VLFICVCFSFVLVISVFACCVCFFFFFFFQAEDGIRDDLVTGVQTCALPILIKERQGLSEYVVFEEVIRRMQLNAQLNKNCLTIFDYAFTEMLNNAIEHSQSKKVRINVETDHANITFIIKDLRIGAIESIKQGFEISDDFLALEHLFKGKQTTAKEAHSGQGIFFTSKVVDTYKIATSHMEFIIDNIKADEFLRDIRQRKGTTVTCKIKINTRRKIKDVFDKYTGDDYEFNQNIVKIN